MNFCPRYTKTSCMTPVDIEDRLKKDFPDCDVVATDLTGGGNHYEVRIASSSFAGLNRVQQHQKVMATFDSELKSGELHALTLKNISERLRRKL